MHLHQAPAAIVVTTHPSCEIFKDIRHVSRYLAFGFAHILSLAAVLSSSLFAGMSSAAATQAARLTDFMADQACAIGPQTRSAAIAAGHDANAVDALIASAKQDSKTVKAGQWLVLSSEQCRIKPPVVASAIKLSDPEVRSAVSSPTVPTAEGEVGCFLDPSRLFQELRRTRFWNEERIYQEYLRMLGASIVSGELTFYSSDPLRTPPSFQLTTGECGNVPHMAQIQRSHENLITLFDPLIRANAENVECIRHASLLTYQLHEIARTLSKGAITNAWVGMELKLIAMGAGWYEGTDAKQPGTPRPPLCHYPA